MSLIMIVFSDRGPGLRHPETAPAKIRGLDWHGKGADATVLMPEGFTREARQYLTAGLKASGGACQDRMEEDYIGPLPKQPARRRLHHMQYS